MKNITDLKTFLARKQLERAQKIQTNTLSQNQSEAQPSQGPQNFHDFQRTQHMYSRGKITMTELSLSLTDGKPDNAANRDKNQSRVSGLADRITDEGI